MEEDDIPTFAARLKEKYPDYKDVDDGELVERIVRKHPVYASQVKLPSDFKLLRTTSGYPKLDAIYEQAGRDNNVDPELLLEQGRQETINFKPDVMYGRQASPAGAVGAGQFMAGTAPKYGITDRSDPVQSINGQAKYMRKLLDQFDNDENLALAGYNSGEYRKSLAQGQIPNIPETQGYVKTIGGALSKIRAQGPTLRYTPEQTPVVPAPVTPTNPNPTPLAPIAPEAPETIQAQTASMLDPKSPRAAVITTDPTQNAQFGNMSGVRAYPIKAGMGGSNTDGTLWISDAKAKKLKLRTPKDVEQFLTNPAAIARLTAKVEPVTDTTKGVAVTTRKNGVEQTSSIVTSPEAAQAQIAVDQQAHPGSQSQIVDAQDVVAGRLVDAYGHAQMGNTDPQPMALPIAGKKAVRGAVQGTVAPSGQQVQPFRVGQPDQAPFASVPMEHTDVKIGAEDLPNPPEVQDVYAGRQADVNQKGYQTPEAYKAQQADLALADTIDLPKNIKSAAAASKYVRDQLQAKHPEGDFSKLPDVVDWKPGSPHALISIGNLKDAGVDTSALVREQQAQQRVENVQPDLHVGKNFVKEDVDALGEQIGKRPATQVAAFLNAFGGKTAEMIAGALRDIETPTIGDPENHPDANVYHFFKELAQLGQSVEDASGVKNITYDKDGRPVLSDDFLTWLDKGGTRLAGDLARLYAMSEALPGAGTSTLGKIATSVGKGAAVFGAQNRFSTLGAGASQAEADKQTLKGIGIGATFGIAKPAAEALSTAVGTLINKGIPAIFTEGATVANIAGPTYLISKASGDTEEQARYETLVNSLFHVAPLVIGKTLGYAGSTLKTIVRENGDVVIAPQDAKVDVTVQKDGTLEPTFQSSPGKAVGKPTDFRDTGETPKVEPITEDEIKASTASVATDDTSAPSVDETGKGVQVAEKPAEPQTVTHPNPAIDGKEIIATTGDGKVVVANPENKSGVSVVTDRTAEAPVGTKLPSEINFPGMQGIIDDVAAGKKTKEQAIEEINKSTYVAQESRDKVIQYLDNAVPETNSQSLAAKTESPNIQFVQAKPNNRIFAMDERDNKVHEFHGIDLELAAEASDIHNLTREQIASAFPSVDASDIVGVDKRNLGLAGSNAYRIKVAFRTPEAAKKALGDVKDLGEGKSIYQHIFGERESSPEPSPTLPEAKTNNPSNEPLTTAAKGVAEDVVRATTPEQAVEPKPVEANSTKSVSSTSPEPAKTQAPDMGSVEAKQEKPVETKFANNKQVTASRVEQIRRELAADVKEQKAEATKEEVGKLGDQAGRVMKALKRIAPKVKFFVHDTPESFAKALKEAGAPEGIKSRAFFNGSDGIHINADLAKSNTAFHEGAHVVIAAALRSNPEFLAQRVGELQKVLPKDVFRKYEKFGEKYDPELRHEEMLSEFLADVADGKLDLDKMEPGRVAALKRWIKSLADKFGMTVKLSSNDDVATFARKLKSAFTEGKELEVVRQMKNASESHEPADVDVDTTVQKGLPKTGRTPKFQREEGVDDEPTLKRATKHLIDIDDVADKPISKVIFYDNTRVGTSSVENAVNGYRPETKLQGGYLYSYIPEVEKNKGVLAFTNIGMATGNLARQRQSPDALQAIASQNPLTSHLGNRSTLETMLGDKGIFQNAASLGSEKELVQTIKKAVADFAKTPLGKNAKVDKIVASPDFAKIRTLAEVRDKIFIGNHDSFGTRGEIFKNLLQQKRGKVSKATRDTHEILNYKYGIPTLDEIARGNNQQGFADAQTGDVVKLVRPFSDPVVYTTDPAQYEYLTKNPTEQMRKAGITIEMLPESMHHTSYPFVLKGENIGVLNEFVAAPDFYQHIDQFKGLKKSQSFYPLGRMPKDAPLGELSPEYTPQGKPSLRHQLADIPEPVRKEMDAVELVKDDEGNLLAPNGKKSNLNEFQYRQTRTPSFKKYFGDWENDPENASRVVDSNGEPMVMYHGTPTSGFLEFGQDKIGKQSNTSGIHFTDSRAVAASYAGTRDEYIPPTDWKDAGLTVEHSERYGEWVVYDPDGNDLAYAETEKAAKTEAQALIDTGEYKPEDPGIYAGFVNLRNSNKTEQYTQDIDLHGGAWSDEIYYNEKTNQYTTHSDYDGRLERKENDEGIDVYYDENGKEIGEFVAFDINHLIKDAKEMDEMGIIVRNVVDDGSAMGSQYSAGESTQAIVFDSTNFKSIHNRGTFNPKDANILHQLGNIPDRKLELYKELGTAHVEAGARTYKDFEKAMLEEGGDALQPHLKGMYDAIRAEHGFEGMDAGPKETPKEPVGIPPREQGQSKIGHSIQAKAIEKGLTEGFGGTAEYSPTTIKKQAELAAKTLNTPGEVERIIAGGELPDGLRGASFIKAVEDAAMESGDVETLRRLAQSPITSETSVHAQELRMMRERTPDSATKLMQDVIKAREDRVKQGKRTPKETIDQEADTIEKSIKQFKKQVTTNRKVWSKFIDAIEC